MGFRVQGIGYRLLNIEFGLQVVVGVGAKVVVRCRLIGGDRFVEDLGMT